MLGKTLSALLLLGMVGCGDRSGSNATPTAPALHVEVRVKNNRLAAVFLRRDRDDKIVFRGFPRGVSFASDAEPPTRLSLPEFQAMVATSAAASDFLGGPSTLVSTATESFNTGFPTGYTPSIGPVAGDCFNFSVQPPNAPTIQLNFLSTDAASSYSSMLSTNDSVKGSYDGFSASDDFSFSDSYQATTNSGLIMFTAQAIYVLQPTLDSATPLNAFGTQQLQAGVFSQICGSSFIDLVPAGMLIMGQLTFSSSSSDASTNVSNTFKGDATSLGSLSSAVTAANSVANSTTTFEFTLSVVGGGDTATAAIMNGYANAQPQFSDCVSGTSSANQTACNTFVGDLNAAASEALNDFTAAANPLPQDLSAFAQLPFGVAGIALPQISAIPLAAIVPGATDVFEPYESQLNEYVTLLNQIGTLNNRVNSIASAVELSSATFDPTALLSLQGYLEQLSLVYGGDRSALLADLNVCLNGTGAVATDCEPIIANTASDAYAWYSTEGPNPNAWSTTQSWMAQQNSIALQYNVTNESERPNGNGQPCGAVTNPMQVMYVAPLPPFASPATQIAGDAALVSFADQTWLTTDKQCKSFPTDESWLLISPIADSSGELSDLSTIGTTMNPPQFWEIIGGNWNAENSFPDPHFTGPPCAPTFNDPCEIGYGTGFDAMKGERSLDLDAIPDLFPAVE